MIYSAYCFAVSGQNTSASFTKRLLLYPLWQNVTNCLVLITLPTHSLEKRSPALDWSRNFVKLSVPWHATFLYLKEKSQTMHQPQKPWGLTLPISNRLLFPDSISSRGPWQGWWIESIVYQFLLIPLYVESSLGKNLGRLGQSLNPEDILHSSTRIISSHVLFATCFPLLSSLQ